MKQETYVYKNAPIPGGGYVTSLMYSEGELYARTDIGGAYHFNKNNQYWDSLINHVTMHDLRETFPIALAREGKKLYIISGIWRRPDAKLSVTDNNGETWRHVDLPFMAHGNLNGRGTGRKLIVENGTLYYASQSQGLWKSDDDGMTWASVDSLEEKYTTFVAKIEDVLIVGSAGVSKAVSDKMRGPALYISRNNGLSFEVLEQPENIDIPEVPLGGYVPQRYTIDDQYLYITFQIEGINAWNKEYGYSCDGGSVWGGRIIRYSLENYSAVEITPKPLGVEGANPMDSGGTFGEKERIIASRKLDILPYGFGGIATCKNKPGLVVAATLSSESGDCIFRSLDYGKSWEIILYDLEIGVMDFRTEYMKPSYNGGHNLIHWLSDLQINPDNENELWFNTGTGPFRTLNLLSDEVHFSDWPDGIEETVHINCYSPHSGEVELLDIVGDLGGFAFRDITKPCTNSFADSDGNRYITCLNADYSDIDPNKIVVTARGNWTGMTKGGIIYSSDQGKSFRHIDQPYGLSAKMDTLLDRIMKPNVNSGWVSLSPDGNNIVWTIGDEIYLPADCVVVSNDAGNSFTKSQIFDLSGKCISDYVPMASEVLPAMEFPGYDYEDNNKPTMPSEAYGFKAFSDRVHDDYFYGFGQYGELFVSIDSGKTFNQVVLYEEGKELTSIDEVNFSLVDTINKTEIRPSNGQSGVFYLALRDKGLIKLTIEIVGGSAKAIIKRLTNNGDIVYRMGLGIVSPEADYLSDEKAIYLAATLGGEYGFYRSTDEGESFVRINDKNQMFGEINSITGDSRHYGRFYLATGSRGILYGEKA